MRRLFGDDFCPAMRCISAAYAGMRCLSVCLSVRVSVTFVSCVKTNKHIFKIFSPSGSFSVPNGMAIFPTGRRMQVGYAEIAILSQYIALLCAVNHSSGKYDTLSCDDRPWRIYNIAGKRRSLLMTRNNSMVALEKAAC